MSIFLFFSLEIPVPSLNQTTPWSDFFPGEKVSLKCVMSSPNWIYTWYKNKTKVQADGSVSFDSNGATLSISSASAAHKGQYTCSGELKGRSVISKASSQLHLTVYGEFPFFKRYTSKNIKYDFITIHMIFFPNFRNHYKVWGLEWDVVWDKHLFKATY